MAPTTETSGPSLIDIIMDDHREVERNFERARTTVDDEAFRSLFSQVIAELVRHSVAEEQYLYPALREHLDDGDEIADHEIAEHAEAEQTMKEIERLDAGDPRLRTKFNELVEEITHHVQDEETQALPRLAAACPRDALIELGAKVERAKVVAPTRPHPSAPDTPPMNKLLAPGTGLVDRVRDALSGRPT